MAGSDFDGQYLGPVDIYLCSEAPYDHGETGEVSDARIAEYCLDAGVYHPKWGEFTAAVPVPTAKATVVWAKGRNNLNGALVAAEAPISVTPPAEPGVRALLDEDEQYVGLPLEVDAMVDGAPVGNEARVYVCDATVLGAAVTPALIAGHCDGAGQAVPVDRVGEATATVTMSASAGAVLVTAELPSGLVGQAVPVTPHEVDVTVTPSTGLADLAIVTVEADDLFRPTIDATWEVQQCHAAGLAGDLYDACTAPVSVEHPEDGVLSTQMVLRRTFTING